MEADSSQTEPPLAPTTVVLAMLDQERQLYLQRWSDCATLAKAIIPAPLGDRVHWSPARQALVVLAGVGTANTAALVSLLGMLPGLDLRASRWIVQGIAGVDPAAGTLGDVFRCTHAVDADLAHEIDRREIPDDWETGIFPLGSEGPYQPPGSPESFGDPYQVFPLPMEAQLPTVSLTTDAKAEAMAAPYGEAATQAAPSIREGAVLSGARFWHGVEMTTWARRWVDLWTEGAGTFAVSSMEDTGTLAAIHLLAKVGRADASRVEIWRSASNFTAPPPGRSATANLLHGSEGENADPIPAMELALENLYRVVDALVDSYRKS